MGNDITAGYTYADTEVGREVTVSNLNQLITEATLKDTAISARTNKSTPELSDKFLLSDGALKYATLQNIKDVLLAAGFITPAMLPNGSVLQTVSAEYTTQSNITGTIPLDNTVPTSSEGAQILSASITPATTSNKVLVRLSGFGGRGSDAQVVIATLFRGSTCINVSACYQTNAATMLVPLVAQVMDSPASASALTYTVRVGGSSADISLNGNTTNGYFGGAARVVLTLHEIKG